MTYDSIFDQTSLKMMIPAFKSSTKYSQLGSLWFGSSRKMNFTKNPFEAFRSPEIFNIWPFIKTLISTFNSLMPLISSSRVPSSTTLLPKELHGIEVIEVVRVFGFAIGTTSILKLSSGAFTRCCFAIRLTDSFKLLQ